MTRTTRRSLFLTPIGLIVGDVGKTGINWKAVWMEPNRITLSGPGEAKPFEVFGIHGADGRAELTGNPYLRIQSSDPKIDEIDETNNRIIAVSPGAVDLRIGFGEATSLARVTVRD